MTKSSAAVIFNNISVNSINSVSGIFVGSNTQWNWNSNSKTNLGFGTVGGEMNKVENPSNIVIDPDFVDYPVIEEHKNLKNSYK